MGVARQVAIGVRNTLRDRGFEMVRIDWDTQLPGPYLSRLLPRYEIGTVLDVGARQGEFGLSLRELGYRGRIASFEPVPDNLAVLEAVTAGDPTWSVHPYALGAAAETKALGVTAWTHFSSFRSARTDVVAADLAKRAVAQTVDVQVRRLDEVWPRVLGSGPGGVFLKCDTQGWDLEVLRGAGERLAEVAVLQSEVSNLPLYEGMPDMLESLAAIRAHGFTVSALFPLNSGPDFTPLEFDCVAVRRPHR